MIVNGVYQEHLTADDSWLDSEGVFETVRTYENRPFAMDRHLGRLWLGMAELGIKAPDPEEVTGSVDELLSKRPFQVGRMRIVVAQDGAWSISHEEYQPSAKELSCLTIKSPWAKNKEITRFKRTNYRERFEIQKSTISKGYDDAIFISELGDFIEGSVCNLLFKIDGAWLTPKLDSGCLAGITRQLLIEHFAVQEAELNIRDLGRVQAVAFTSSLREIQGIKRIDGNLFTDSGSVSEFRDIFHTWILGNLLP